MAAKPKAVIVPKEDKLQLNLANWSYRDFLNFQKWSARDPQRAYALAQKVISSWTYDIDVKEKDALARLPIEDAALVLQTIGNTLEAYFEQTDVSEVVVDFRAGGWNSLVIFEFQRALQEFDYSAITTMLHQVASLPNVDPNEALPLIEGAMMVKAVTTRYGRIMSGKV